jgi:hypothetical protein
MNYLFSLPAMRFLILSGLFFLTSCASLFNPPPKVHPDDALGYFVIDISEVPGNFQNVFLTSVNNDWVTGTGWSTEFRKDGKILVGFTYLPNDRPIYLSEFHFHDWGLFSGNSTHVYKMTPQESPIRFERAKRENQIRLGGMMKMKVQDGGTFSKSSFRVERCRDCPSEKEVLRFLLGLAEKAKDESGAILAENQFLEKLKKKLADLP